MRLRVVIDDDLLAVAKKATGLKSTKAVVEKALMAAVRTGRDPEPDPEWEIIDHSGGKLPVWKRTPNK